MIIAHSTVGGELTQAEYHSDGAHIINGSTDYSVIVPSGTEPFTGYIDLKENAIPAVPSTNVLRLYVEDINGFSFFSFVDDKGMVRKLVRDSVFVGKNMTAAVIPALSNVYAAGSTSGVPALDLALADSTATMPSLGITCESISTGAYGRVMQVGLLENINTVGITPGTVGYVSPVTPGGYAWTPPTYPSLRQEVCTILVQDATGGSAQVVSRSVTLNPSDIVYEDNLASNSTTQMVLEHNVKTYADTKLPKQMTENDPLILDAAMSAQGQYCGITEKGDAGAALGFGDLAYFSVTDSKWEKAYASTNYAEGKLGICVTAAAENATTSMLLWGKVRAAKFPAMTVGAPVYISSSSAYVQVTAPTSVAAVMRVVGRANTEDELFFNPSPDWFVHV